MKLHKPQFLQKLSRFRFKRSSAQQEQGNRELRLDALKMNPLRSIGMQLFISFFLAIVIGVASVGFISYNKSVSLVENQVSESKRLTSIQAAEKMGLVLKQYEDTSFEIMFLPEISELSTSTRLFPEEIIEQLELRREIESRVNSYIFSDSTVAGIHLISVDPLLPTMSTLGVNDEQLKETDWFKRAVESSGEGFWLPTTERGPTGMAQGPTFGYVRLMKDQHTFLPAYVFVMEIREARLQQVVLEALGKGSEMYVLDAENKVISASDKALIGKPFFVPLEGVSATGAAFRAEIHGEETLVAHAELDGLGWKLVGAQPFKPLVAGANTIRDLTFVMIAVGAAAAVLIGWLAASRIGSPIQQISRVMKQAGAGDLSVRAPQGKRKDEIGTLSNGFNDMIENFRTLVWQAHESIQEVMDTARELSEASQRTASSAKEIAVATEQIAIGASNVAIEAEKVTDVTVDMGDKMAITVRANSELSAAASDIQRSSQQGTLYMQALSEKTSETERLTLSMVQKVEHLQQSTSSIRNILQLLDNITKQTNILSLNAAIEAARAGEAGRGFMVVADEIRKLADQSKQSIETVGQITETVNQEIEETVRLMGQAYPLFQEQIGSVKQSNEIFLTVQDRMDDFVSQLDSVTQAVSKLESTQRTLASAMASVSAVAEESSATTEEVASLSADQLQVGESLVRLAGRLDDVKIRLRDSLNKFQL